MLDIDRLILLSNVRRDSARRYVVCFVSMFSATPSLLCLHEHLPSNCFKGKKKRKHCSFPFFNQVPFSEHWFEKNRKFYVTTSLAVSQDGCVWFAFSAKRNDVTGLCMICFRLRLWLCDWYRNRRREEPSLLLQTCHEWRTGIIQEHWGPSGGAAWPHTVWGTVCPLLGLHSYCGLVRSIMLLYNEQFYRTGNWSLISFMSPSLSVSCLQCLHELSLLCSAQCCLDCGITGRYSLQHSCFCVLWERHRPHSDEI